LKCVFLIYSDNLQVLRIQRQVKVQLKEG
jgi:hypothetical protein